MNNRIDELLDDRHRQVLTAISGVHDRLDIINGRTRTLENKVSVLSWAYAAGATVLSFISYRVFGQQP